MNISHYIQELLFTKQKVVLPYIGSFEMVSKPAHIDGATGTITPPSKTIKFNHNEGTDYSVLVNHIAKRNGISTAKALKLACAYSEEINNRLNNGEEVEIVGIGILRVIGSGTVIFLPFSSYSNLGESFGLPTISIKKKITPAEIEETEEEEGTVEEPESEVQHIIEEAAFSTEVGERNYATEEEEPFELIEDFIEETPTISEPQPEKTALTEQKEETSETTLDTPIEEFGEHEEKTASLEPEVTTETEERPFEKIEAVIPVFATEIKERKTEETSIEEKETIQEKESPEVSLAKEEPIAEESSSAKEAKNIATPKKSRRSWIWPSLVVICILAIALVALYHYNPNIYSFIIPSDKGMVLEPAIPSDVDSSYYKTLASAATDTSTAIDDSTRIDSARANLQKIDSTSKKTIATKAAVKTPSLSGKKPMSKEEMEMLINEKLKLGNSATPKAVDTPQKASTNNKQLQEVKQPKQTTGGYQVIAASVETMKEAQKIAELLKAKGYNPQILESGKNRIRISIGSYPTSRQAVNAANAAKNKIGSGVWILNPQ